MRRLAGFLLALVAVSPVLAGPIEDLLPGEWYEVPNSNMRDVVECGGTNGGTCSDPSDPTQACYESYDIYDASHIMDGWNGGAFDTVRDRLIVWGGGHGGWAGNAVYVFDLDTLAWERVGEPSCLNGTAAPDGDLCALAECQANESGGFYADGGPRMRHTYNYIQYVPYLDALCSCGGGGFTVSGQTGNSKTICFDFTTETWSADGTYTDTPSAGIGAFSAVDPLTGELWCRGNGGSGCSMSVWDPSTDTWTERSAGQGDCSIYYSTGDIDPVNGVFVTAGETRHYAWDLDAVGNITRETISGTGDTEFVSTNASGFEWDTQEEIFVGWEGGTDVYTFDYGTSVWTQVLAAGTNTVTPTAKNSNGTYGRWRYSPNKNVYVLVNDVDENVYIYRYSADDSPTACDDSVDNDSDGLTDYPDDPGCSSALDDNELAWEGGSPPTEVVGFTVKESNGVAVTDYPVSVVIPLPDDTYSVTAPFAIYDEDATSPDNIPAQFTVLERDWIEDATPTDNSIVHVVAHFQATVGASSTRSYRFHVDGSNPAPADPVSVVDSASVYTVTTGPLEFTTDQTSFKILDTVWYDADDDDSYETGERIIISNAAHGAIPVACDDVGLNTDCSATLAQPDTEQAPDECEVEESGPMRVVLRCERYTDYNGVNDHEHGMVTRIYAYAGKPWVKIDYQLVNAATGPALDSSKWAKPWYFDSVDLEWDLELSGTVTVKTSIEGDAVDSRTLDANGVEFAYTMHDEFAVRHADGSPDYDSCADNGSPGAGENDCDTAGFLDVGNGTFGVQAIVRNMWEMWPNGIEVTDATDYALQIQLWPDWSSQWEYRLGTPALDTTTGGDTAGIYWLDDMRAVYKEVLLNFHEATPADATLTALAKTFDRHPIGVIDLADVKGKSTYDGESNTELAAYAGSSLLDTNTAAALDEDTSSGYRMGWARWYAADIGRLIDPNATGSGPIGAEVFLHEGDPQSWWEMERNSISELNARAHWMGRDYTYADDWATIGLTESSYGSGLWRAQGDTSSYSIAGTGDETQAWHDSHFWAYHIYNHYWSSGNPWIKDWLNFVGEMKRSRLNDVDTATESDMRNVGHFLAGVLAAYRATGDNAFLEEYADYIQDYQLPLLQFCGTVPESTESANPHAFLNRALLDAADKLRGNDWERWADVFSFVSASIEWDHHYGHHGYQVESGYGTCGENTASPPGGGTGWNVPDTFARYYWTTGKTRFKTDIDAYVALGDSEGGPYVDNGFFPNPAWAADRWTGRYYWWMDDQTRADSTAPTAVSDLASYYAGSNLSMVWTPPVDASYYLIVWSGKSITECTTDCPNDANSTDAVNYDNWWSATPYACDTTDCPGTAELTVTCDPCYVSIFAFDAADNMSAMSNLSLSIPGSVMTGGALGGGSIK